MCIKTVNMEKQLSLQRIPRILDIDSGCVHGLHLSWDTSFLPQFFFMDFLSPTKENLG